MTKISTSSPIADAAMTALPLLGVVLEMRERRGIREPGRQGGGSDLRVEDVLERLDALVANLRRELHREAGALDRHDRRGGVVDVAGRQVLRGAGGVLLQRVELAELIGK